MAFATQNTWSDGEVLTHTDLNQNFTDIEGELNGTTDTSTYTIHAARMASHTHATEYTTTNTAFQDKNVWTFTPDSSNNIILGIYHTCWIKHETGNGVDAAYAQVKILTASGESIYLPSNDLDANSQHSHNNNTWTQKTWYMPGILMDVGGAQNGLIESMAMLQASYTLTTRIRVNASGTAHIKDQSIKIIYLDEVFEKNAAISVA